MDIDSSSTDHVIVQNSCSRNPRELDTNVTNPDSGNTEVLGIGEVEILAKHTLKKLKPLVLKGALFLSRYRTNFVSVSSIVDNGYENVHEKGQNVLCLKSQGTIPIERKGKLSFLRTSLNLVTMLQT